MRGEERVEKEAIFMSVLRAEEVKHADDDDYY